MGSFLSDTHSSNPFQINIAKNSKCTGREKTSEKKRHQILSFNLCVVTNFFVPSVFWGEVSNS
jgi:hypothetical protein